jgi:chlorobactene glucosyltransferase
LDTKRKKWPFVSVCLPARNEEKRIGPCLEGFLKQDYPRYEVLILDDQSTDGTWRLLQRTARRDPRFKLFQGTPLPRGWVGKPWACRQLARRARGEWLLFTDADTWHRSDTLKRTVQAAEAEGSDLLTFMTAQETRSWMEILVIPALCFDLISFYPQSWVLRKGNPLNSYVWANGQFLFFRRKHYLSIGGHAAVKDRIDEDLTFGKITVKRGMRLSLLNGSDLVTCRMYTSAVDVWRGFSKIIFPSFQYSSLKSVAGLLFTSFLTILPFVLPWFTTPGSFLFCSALLAAAVQTLLRLDQSRRFGFSVLSAWLHPLGQFFLVLMGFNSIRWYLFSGRGHWRGRTISLPSKASGVVR